MIPQSLVDALADGLRIIKENDASTVKLVPRDKNGKPLAALIIVGPREAVEIIEAVEAVEDRK